MNLALQLKINGNEVILNHEQEAELKLLLASFVKDKVESIHLEAGNVYE